MQSTLTCVDRIFWKVLNTSFGAAALVKVVEVRVEGPNPPQDYKVEEESVSTKEKPA